MAEVWQKCTECKTDIPFGGRHYLCSVSTCKRSKMRLAFCSVVCWDSHLSSIRHREAWAEDAVAPTRDAWHRELAAQAQTSDRPPATPPHGVRPAPVLVVRPSVSSAPLVRSPVSSAPLVRPGAPAVAPSPSAVRRVVGEASPSVAAQLEGVTLSEVTDQDMLIVISKMKKYIKDRSGMNCSDALADVLSEYVRALCDDAIRSATRDERKTVLDRDLSRPRR